MKEYDSKYNIPGNFTVDSKFLLITTMKASVMIEMMLKKIKNGRYLKISYIPNTDNTIIKIDDVD